MQKEFYERQAHYFRTNTFYFLPKIREGVVNTESRRKEGTFFHLKCKSYHTKLKLRLCDVNLKGVCNDQTGSRALFLATSLVRGVLHLWLNQIFPIFFQQKEKLNPCRFCCVAALIQYQYFDMLRLIVLCPVAFLAGEKRVRARHKRSTSNTGIQVRDDRIVRRLIKCSSRENRA